MGAAGGALASDFRLGLEHFGDLNATVEAKLLDGRESGRIVRDAEEESGFTGSAAVVCPGDEAIKLGSGDVLIWAQVADEANAYSGKLSDSRCGELWDLHGEVLAVERAFACVFSDARPLATIVSGGDTEMRPECSTERLVILIPARQRDCQNARFLHSELKGCLLETEAVHVGLWRLSGRVAKELMKVKLGDAGLIGQDVKRQILVEVCLDVNESGNDALQRWFEPVVTHLDRLPRTARIVKILLATGAIVAFDWISDDKNGKESTMAVSLGRGVYPLRIVGTAILALVLLVVGHILYMVVYSYGINPGRGLTFYQDYAQRSGPVFAAIVGPLVLTLLCWRMFRRLDGPVMRSCLAVAAFLTIVDLGLQVAMDGFHFTDVILAAHAGKFVGAWLGGELATKDQIIRGLRGHNQVGAD